MAGASEDARAHGEKSQQAFLRMRTIHWYDLNWSTDKLRVNDKMTVSGKFHVFYVHTMMNVMAAGPIIGPGKWVQIDGSMSDYKHVITTLTGVTEDIEKVGTAGIYGWSFFWIFFGFAWIGYWVAKPVFVPRYMARKAGDESIVLSLIHI